MNLKLNSNDVFCRNICIVKHIKLKIHSAVLKGRAYFDRWSCITNSLNTMDKGKHGILISELMYSTKDRLLAHPIVACTKSHLANVVLTNSAFNQKAILLNSSIFVFTLGYILFIFCKIYTNYKLFSSFH